MFKRLLSNIKETIKEEYKFIIFSILLICILNYPLNYYIVIGGGISDASSRINVEGQKKSKGSFNISYVTELNGTLFTYGLSYLIPTWERESANDYKYSTNESISDIEFRSDLDLLTSNGNATYWAYKLANKEAKLKNKKLYIIIIFDGYDTPLKVGDEIISVDGNTYDTSPCTYHSRRQFPTCLSEPELFHTYSQDVFSTKQDTH